MRVIFFCHSLVSDWNHGNAHFLRGVWQRIARARDHEVRVFEQAGGVEQRQIWWLNTGNRRWPVLRAHIPSFTAKPTTSATLDLDQARWPTPTWCWCTSGTSIEVVEAIGGTSGNVHGRYRLLFHDTHHRWVTDRAPWARYGPVTTTACWHMAKIDSRSYLAMAGHQRAWVWHEAADTTVFKPLIGAGDMQATWSGSATGAMRSAAAELEEFLLNR